MRTYADLKKRARRFRFGSTILNFTTTYVFAIKAVYGIGVSKATFIISLLGLGKSFRIELINIFIYDSSLKLFKDNFFLDKRLQELVSQQLEFAWDSGLISGQRLWLGLPTNGQRTRSNGGGPERLKPSSPRVTPLVKEFEVKWQKYAQEQAKTKKKRK